MQVDEEHNHGHICNVRQQIEIPSQSIETKLAQSAVLCPSATMGGKMADALVSELAPQTHILSDRPATILVQGCFFSKDRTNLRVHKHSIAISLAGNTTED